ncbi:MAG: hypothetical protein QOD67_2771 [Caballeronia sp.]|nr:hypothetical protein [Caballeronia sp.]
MTGFSAPGPVVIAEFVGNPPPNTSPTAFFLEAPHEAPCTPPFSTPFIEA